MGCCRGTDASAAWPPPLVEQVVRLALRSVHTPNEEQRPRFVEIVRALRALSEQFPKTSAAAGCATIVPNSVVVRQVGGASASQGASGPSAGYSQNASSSAQGGPPNRDIAKAGAPMVGSPS